MTYTTIYAPADCLDKINNAIDKDNKIVLQDRYCVVYKAKISDKVAKKLKKICDYEIVVY